VYDHTSILKLIEQKWNLPPLTRRDAAATDPLDALDFDNTPHFLTAPTLPPRRGSGMDNSAWQCCHSVHLAVPRTPRGPNREVPDGRRE
jgi:hypothetical protein